MCKDQKEIELLTCNCGKIPKFRPSHVCGDWPSPATVSCTCSRKVTSGIIVVSYEGGVDEEESMFMMDDRARRLWNTCVRENFKSQLEAAWDE